MRMLAFAFALPLLFVALALPATVGAQQIKQVEMVNLPEVQSVEVTNLPEVQDVRIVGGTVAVNLFDEEIIVGGTTETRFLDVSGHSILRFLATRSPINNTAATEVFVSFSLENTPDAFVQVLGPLSISATEIKFQVDVWGPTARIEVQTS